MKCVSISELLERENRGLLNANMRWNRAWVVLVISEILLALITFMRGYKRSEKNNDKWSMLIVIAGFIGCIYFSFFFRSVRFAENIGQWLLPNIFESIGVICMVL